MSDYRTALDGAESDSHQPDDQSGTTKRLVNGSQSSWKLTGSYDPKDADVPVTVTTALILLMILIAMAIL